MSYLVLARKLRPAQFKDIIGQDTICQTLINAIVADRVAHAFLFTGPRGTGKTSCARILTKALNCLSPIEYEPCNKCENCKEINQGISTDVIEIDAASNRGIEHIRELRERVKFSPAKCRYKTYIIDEVHMLTPESFNALLKTLEEPPSHVKFVLATTDHHKIPPTVISRCQRYDFSNIRIDTMVEFLKIVVSNESITISDSALHLIAKSSTGGMRDALTTVDMLIGSGDNSIDDENVVEILGLNTAREIDGLLETIVNRNVSEVLSRFHQLMGKGRSLTQLVTDLMGAVKDLSMVKSLTTDQIQWHDFLPGQLELYRDLAVKTTTGTLQQYFHILLEIESQIKRSTQAVICVEMGLMKLCSVESLAGVAEIISLLREAGSSKKKIARPHKKTSIQPSANKSQLTHSRPKPQLINNHAGYDSPPLESLEIPIDLEPEINWDPPPIKTELPNKVKEETGTETETALSQTSIQWKEFVDIIAQSLNKSLVSLLRNSVLLELNDDQLVIGYQNLKVFTEDKRRIIEKNAKKFFNERISVAYKEAATGIDISLKEQSDLEKERQLDEKKHIARQDEKVLQIKKVFPDAEIKHITVLEE